MDLGVILYTVFSSFFQLISMYIYQCIKGSRICHILNKFMSIFE